MKFLVLGGGAQGTAAAFDLLHHGGADRVVIADLATDAVHGCLRPYLGDRLSLVELDAAAEDDVAAAMETMDGVLCALPYHFNLAMARLAVAAGTHFTDLGGNTAIVNRQRELHDQARERGVSVVPDTGLAPGMVNILAQAGIDALDRADAVRLWVGGLPQNPKPPLNYQIVYSLEGMLDYYVTPATILRGGEPTRVEALSGLEHLEFPEPVGRLEAFFTGGGTSALPFRHQGRVDTLEYKTLRYPGHARIMRAVRDLGLLSDREVAHNGARVNPRSFFIERVTPFLTADEANDEDGDVVIVRVDAAGHRNGRPELIRYELVDRRDPATGISAMARTTGFSLAITALLQTGGHMSPGVGTPDEAVPQDRYIDALRARGIDVVRTTRAERAGGRPANDQPADEPTAQPAGHTPAS